MGASRPPRPTRAGRLFDYLRQMFPVAVTAPVVLANVVSIYLALQALTGQTKLSLTWRVPLVALSLLLFSLLLRVFDELKDVETDLRLGRAGDPRYKDRAIVTGHVQQADLVALRWGVTVLLFAVSLPLGFPGPALAFVAMYGFAWLSFRWFFWPAVSRHLLLALATHGPLSLALAGYVVAVCRHDLGVPWSSGGGWLLIGAWTPILAWETSRKVRAPEEETDYQTYSKVLGWKVAPFLPLCFIGISAACLMALGRALSLSPVYWLALGLAAAVAMGACLAFRLRPTPARANLRPWAEAYALVATLAPPVALWLRYSVALES